MLFNHTETNAVFFTLKPRQRRQNEIIQKLVQMVGKNVLLYDTILQFLRTLFLRTKNVHYCTLRVELLMALHDMGECCATSLRHDAYIMSLLRIAQRFPISPPWTLYTSLRGVSTRAFVLRCFCCLVAVVRMLNSLTPFRTSIRSGRANCKASWTDFARARNKCSVTCRWRFAIRTRLISWPPPH